MKSSIRKCNRKGNHILKMTFIIDQNGINNFISVRIVGIRYRKGGNNRRFRQRRPGTLNVMDGVIICVVTTINYRNVRRRVKERRI